MRATRLLWALALALVLVEGGWAQRSLYDVLGATGVQVGAPGNPTWDPGQYGQLYAQAMPGTGTSQTPLGTLTGEEDGASVPVGGGGSYTVVSGDSLSAIAQRLCGDAGGWPAIYEANRNQIRDPNLIYPGQTFRIPCQGGATPPTPSSAQNPPGTPPARPGGGATGRILPHGPGALTHLPLPPRTYRVSSEFGPRTSFPAGNGQASSDHGGIDLSAPSGTGISAAGPGTVIHAGWAGGYGFAVYIRHADGTVTRYGHLRQQPLVRAGQRVDGGQLIGQVGSTGNSTGPHLHFEVRPAGGAPQNPRHFCRF